MASPEGTSKGPLNRVTLSELQMGAILDRACPELLLRKAAQEHQQDKLTDRDRRDAGLHMADYTAPTTVSQVCIEWQSDTASPGVHIDLSHIAQQQTPFVVPKCNSSEPGSR